MTDKLSILRFSIIIPLEFHRGQVEACLRRWAYEQTYARNQYEIVAVGCRNSLDQEALSFLRSKLGPYDRLLLFDEPHDMALCAHAAQQAKGEVLFFTESHCLPESNILSVADETLRTHPEWAGFSCRSLRITHNSLSIVEADMYEADIRYGMEAHPWRKILDQCFVVRAESYHDAGGFRPELGHFAEWHLAAQMHQMGCQIGYAPDAKVLHYYAGNIDELIEFSADFARGEMAYHSDFVNDPSHSYFQEPIEWRTRHQWAPRLAGKAFLLAWQAHSKFVWQFLNPFELIARCILLLESGLRAYYGAKPVIVAAHLRFQIARWGLQLGLLLRIGRRFLRTLFLRLIDATVRLERIRFIQHWLEKMTANAESIYVFTPAASLNWQPDLSHTFCSTGFYATEEWHGQKFACSEPVGMIEVSLQPGNYRFSIEWLPVKNIKNLIVYLDEKPIPAVRESCKISSLRFQVDSTHPLRFSWTCEPWFSPRDPRLVGLPVVSISWTPAN